MFFVVVNNNKINPERDQSWKHICKCENKYNDIDLTNGNLS